jgi:hypothetical protein
MTPITRPVLFADFILTSKKVDSPDRNVPADGSVYGEVTRRVSAWAFPVTVGE